MATLNRTFSVKNGIDVANTIIIDPSRNISNIVSANITQTINAATVNVTSANIAENARANLIISTKTAVAAPNTSHTDGERLRLFDFNQAGHPNYAIGVEPNYIWAGTDENNGGTGFKWYGNTTQSAVMRSNGTLQLSNTVEAKVIKANGTGTAIDASQGNVLTNQVTGTQFNFLNGSYTVSLNGGGATSNYTLSLPSNTGLVGQALTTDGTGNLIWSGESYAQANGAYAQANGAYSQANGAYAQANGAYSQANGAYSQANGAYDQANTAANTVRVYANSAGGLSNKFLNFVNTASVQVSVTDNGDGNANITFATTGAAVADVYAQANAAYGQANTARDTANGAYAQANGAYAQANGAYGQANGAYAQANGAYNQANGAYSQANGAYSQANLKVASITVSGNGLAVSNATSSNNNEYTLSVNTASTTDRGTTLLIDSTSSTDTGNAATANAVNAAFNYAATKLPLTGGTISGDLTIDGNLYLSMNTTLINVSTYQVEDPLIYLASNNDISDTVDIGFMGGKNNSGTYAHTGLIRHAADQKYYLFDGLADEAHTNNVVNVAATYLATLRANLEANSILLVGNTVATQANLTIANDQANAAYGQANTARGTANDAYAQANTARGTANDAYGQANTARTTANDAYAQANAGYLQANTAYGQANDAYAQANTARTTANDAYGQANAGYSQANTARTTANDAYAQANTARTTANDAYGQANAAYNHANTKVSKSGDTMTGSLTITTSGIGLTVANANVTYSLQVGSLNVTTNTVTTSSSGQVVLDVFPASQLASAKYFIQANSASDYHTTEMVLVQDATNVWITEYGSIQTGPSLGTFSADISSGDVRLLFNATNNINTIRAVRYGIIP